jgi:hypothetical protein
MENLDGLNNVTSIGGDLTIEDNPFLTGFCGIQPLLNVGGVSGVYTVNNNAFNPTISQVLELVCN